MLLLWLPTKIPGQRNAQQCHLDFCLTRLIVDFGDTVFPRLYKLGDRVSIRNEMFELKKNNSNMSAIAILTTVRVSLTTSYPGPLWK